MEQLANFKTWFSLFICVIIFFTLERLFQCACRFIKAHAWKIKVAKIKQQFIAGLKLNYLFVHICVRDMDFYLWLIRSPQRMSKGIIRLLCLYLLKWACNLWISAWYYVGTHTLLRSPSSIFQRVLLWWWRVYQLQTFDIASIFLVHQ